jgi:hypothetical protein
MKTPQARISPALVIASVALAVALSGPALAVAGSLAPGSVGTAALKDGAVTTRKIAGGEVTSGKVANGSLQRADIAPAGRLPRGRVGLKTNSVTLINGWLLMSSVSLGPGRWFISAKTDVSGQYTIECRLRKDGDALALDASQGWHEISSRFILPVQTVVTLTEEASIYSECWGPDDQVYDRDMYAVEVAP